jgi:hypothetical protein
MISSHRQCLHPLAAITIEATQSVGIYRFHYSPSNIVRKEMYRSSNPLHRNWLVAEVKPVQGDKP